MPPVQAGKFHLGGIFLNVIICDDYKSQSAAGADTIEKIARERYFMKMDDEDIFVLSDDQRTPNTHSNETVD